MLWPYFFDPPITIVCSSFDSDTGLVKAIETVANYNQLMKDFPLSGLLSASDTEAIRIAIVDIFAHMKKMRGTRYPVIRATKLIQTLSRDLSDQLLRVLSGQGLMHVRYLALNTEMGNIEGKRV